MRPLLTVAMALCLIGAIDSALDGAWDQVVLFVARCCCIAVASGAGTRSDGPSRCASDLSDWLRSRSELTGEPVETLADRAVAAHRAGLTGLEDPP